MKTDALLIANRELGLHVNVERTYEMLTYGEYNGGGGNHHRK